MQEEKSYWRDLKDFSYTCDMRTQDDIRKFILEQSQARSEGSKGTLSVWSKGIGRNHAYLHQFINKKSPKKLSEDDRGKLAELMEVPETALKIGSYEIEMDIRSEDVAAGLDKAPAPAVKVKGYVGAGSEAHFYALSDEDFAEVPAPAGASDQTVAVEIKGSSWGPRMNTWLVFYDDVRSPVTTDLIGQVCVVGLSDDRILIKEIQRNGHGGYRLLANTSLDDVIEDAKIEWAAKVIGMRPR